MPVRLKLYLFLLMDALQGLYRRVVDLPELFTRQYWQYRKASLLLLHARHYLSRRNVVGTDWDAMATLIEAYWRVEDEYFDQRRKSE